MISTSSVNTKEFFRVFGIFLGIIAVFFLILVGMVKCSGNSSDKELKEVVQSVLDERMPDQWNVLEKVEISSPFKLSSVLYSIQNKKTGQHAYAIMVRTATLYGPFPAVFTYMDGKKPVFVGYGAVHGRIKTILEENNSNIRMNYWMEKIPRIIEDSTGDDK